MSDMNGLDELGRTQFGLISRAQAEKKKVSAGGIRWRLAQGEWEPFRRGVYRFRATTNTWSQHAMGALLFAGEPSALSHQTAAFLFKLDGFTKKPPVVFDVTVPARKYLKATGIRFHRIRTDIPIESVRGLRTTSMAKTLVDLSAVVGLKQLEFALDSARRLRASLAEELEAYFETLRETRPPVALLKQLLASRKGPMDSLKEVELLQVIAQRGLPPPTPGYSVYDGRRFIMKVDGAWVDRKVAVHFDSYRWHHQRERFERDARQRSVLAGLHWQNIIVTDRSLHSHDWSDALKRLLLPELSPAHR